jgi:ribosomal protein S12 methylthiotransferase accessory factor
VEIERCVAALKKLDMEVLLIDTMHADLQIPTLYTIIPGAHFRERSMIRNAGLFAAKLIAESDMDSEAINQRLTELHDIVPNAYYLEFYLGRNLLAMEQHDEALPHFRQALQLQPEDEDMPYIHSYLGHCLKDMARYPEAIMELEKGLALDDERPDMHNALGVCHFKQQEYEAAIRHFQRAVELAPASAIDYANLGINYKKLGQSEEAVKNFEIALDLDPSIDWARSLLAELTASA